jgi:NADPH:quinone reductase-like Zn-dependent oxidoreductase
MAALVRSGGRVVSIVAPPDVEGLAERGVNGVLTSRWATEDKFPELTSKVADGGLKLPPIQTFPFDDLSTALGLQATRHVRGKLAIVVAEQ